jgi:hypothetical protein
VGAIDEGEKDKSLEDRADFQALLARLGMEK